MMHVQNCCLANLNLFAVFIAVAINVALAP